MPRRPRPVSRRPPKNSKSAQKTLKPRSLPPDLVATLKPRVEEPSGSSPEEDEDEEDRLEVMEEGSDNSGDEEYADTPRISQWVDDDEGLYKHINDEPVSPSVHRDSYKYI